MDLAQLHSENMVKHKFYAHVDHLGRNPIDRAEKYKVKAWVRKGNRFTGIAENIAQTPWFENVRGVWRYPNGRKFSPMYGHGWKNSPPHYKNILGDYTHLGVGLYFDEKGMGFGTQTFARLPFDAFPFVFGTQTVGTQEFFLPLVRSNQ